MSVSSSSCQASAGKIALLTGGAGFIGSHVLERLVTDGYIVRVLDNFVSGKPENLGSHLHTVEFFQGDIRNGELVSDIIRGVDTIIHLAALGSVTRSFSAPEETLSVNVLGTTTVLEAALENGVRRLVYASSSSVYGDSRAATKREEAPVRPKSPYALSKLFGEKLCAHYAARRGRLDTVCLRFFNVFGPRQDPTSEYAAVVPRFVQSALSGSPPLIEGDGKQSRDFTPVQAVVEAVMLSALHPRRLRGQVFNVALGGSLSVNELWTLVARMVPRPPTPRYGPARVGDVRHSRACVERAASVLGYSPSVTVEQAIREVLQYYSGFRQDTPPTAVVERRV